FPLHETALDHQQGLALMPAHDLALAIAQRIALLHEPKDHCHVTFDIVSIVTVLGAYCICEGSKDSGVPLIVSWGEDVDPHYAPTGSYLRLRASNRSGAA